MINKLTEAAIEGLGQFVSITVIVNSTYLLRVLVKRPNIDQTILNPLK